MITLIHGNDNLSSRRYFLSQKDDESITFDAESLNIVEFEQSLQGGGLFSNPKKIFIENLFTRKGSKNISSIGEILSSNTDSQIFIWAEKEVGIKTLANFPKIDNQNFKIPQTIWSFLDGTRPNNPSNVTLFHSALNGSEPEIVFAMLTRQFRLLIGISSDSKNNAEEVKKLAPWQKTKLIKQASLFGKEKLKDIYKKIYKIEKGTKTGSSNLDLIQNIDILLLEI